MVIVGKKEGEGEQKDEEEDCRCMTVRDDGGRVRMLRADGRE